MKEFKNEAPNSAEGEIENSQVSIYYEGLYASDLAWNSEILEHCSHESNLKSHIYITQTSHTDFDANPNDVSKHYSVIPSFSTGEITININHLQIAGQSTFPPRPSEVLFVHKMNNALEEGILEAIRLEKMLLMQESLGIAAFELLFISGSLGSAAGFVSVTSHAITEWQEVIQQNKNLFKEIIDPGRVVIPSVYAALLGLGFYKFGELAAKFPTKLDEYIRMHRIDNYFDSTNERVNPFLHWQHYKRGTSIVGKEPILALKEDVYVQKL